MAALVTLEQVKDHLYIDPDYDNDNDLILKIQAASNIILNYLSKEGRPYETDSSGDPVVDSSGDPIPREEVKMATLLLVGILFKDREGAVGWGQGYLPFHITALIYQLRDPALA